MHNRLHMARFAVILEAYLKGCGEALLVIDSVYDESTVIKIVHSPPPPPKLQTKFTDQVDIQKSLCDMATRVCTGSV